MWSIDNCKLIESTATYYILFCFSICASLFDKFVYLTNEYEWLQSKIKSKMLLISYGRTLRKKTYAKRKLWILRLIRIYFHLNGLLEFSHLWSSVLIAREWSDRPSDSLWVTRRRFWHCRGYPFISQLQAGCKPSFATIT